MKLCSQIVLEQEVTNLSAKIAIKESSDDVSKLHKKVADYKLQIVSIATYMIVS